MTNKIRPPKFATCEIIGKTINCRLVVDDSFDGGYHVLISDCGRILLEKNPSTSQIPKYKTLVQESSDYGYLDELAIHVDAYPVNKIEELHVLVHCFIRACVFAIDGDANREEAMLPKTHVSYLHEILREMLQDAMDANKTATKEDELGKEWMEGQ